MTSEEEFLKKIKETFKVEAEDHLQEISSGLMALEKEKTSSGRLSIVESIFRASHSLKGASRAVDMYEVEEICQSMENIFSELKKHADELPPKLFDSLHGAVNILNEFIFSKEKTGDAEHKKKVSNIKDQLFKWETSRMDSFPGLEQIEKISELEKIHSIEETFEVGNSEIESKITGQASQKKAVSGMRLPSIDTVRISTDKLDDLLVQVEEMLSVKLTTNQRAEDTWRNLSKLNVWKKEISGLFPLINDISQYLEKKEHLDKNDLRFEKLLQFIDWADSFIKSVEGESIKLRKETYKDSFSTGSKIDGLLDEVKKVISVPFSTLLDIFPKTVRDLSHDQGKDVDFIVEGGEIEVDRRILENLKSPLLHIIRNCIDHGIEEPNKRTMKNKPSRGLISIIIKRLESNKVEIEISDDGEGIDLGKLREAYKKNKRTSAAETKKEELLTFIFESGISTSEIITDISGRGLGLAIVQEKIEQLSGSIDIETDKNTGTTFRIVLPLTMVAFRGVLMEVSGQQFVAPTSKIERIVRYKKTDIKTIENRETIPFNGGVVPLVNLADILEFLPQESDSELVQVMILKSDGKHIGFLINNVLNEQEVIVKNFSKNLSRIRNISGATTLGSGKVVPILRVSDLIKSASKESFISTKLIAPVREDEETRNSVLIAEDSITSRMLLKNILESAGYRVKTAVDGLAAFTALREGDFNILVSDIDMPRMNGFDLTSKIRKDKKLSELPVVLVTSLQSREDRERGIESGANAYVVKSNFAQSNLLEIVKKLL